MGMARRRTITEHGRLLIERDLLVDERIALRDGITRMGEELDNLRSERDAARHELALTPRDIVVASHTSVA